MEIKGYVEALLESALKAGCGAAEVCVTENDELSVGVLEGEVEDYSVSSSFALGLRVQLGGRNGYAYTEIADDAETLVAEAMDSARTVKSEDEHPMQTASKYPTAAQKRDALAGMDEAAKIELCRALEREAKQADGRVERVAVCRVVTAGGKFCIYNTLGLKAEREDSISCCYVEPVISQNGEVRDGFAFRVDAEAADIAACAHEAVDEAIAQLGASPVAAGKYRVLLRNDAAASIIAAFSGMFSADAAQKGLSPLRDKLGSYIAAKCVTLVDDPLYPLNPSPFDDEGTPSVSKAVIENGILKTFLHNLKTAKKAGAASTSNAGRGSAGSPVGVRPTNFYITPDKASFAELVRELGTGLLITDFSGLHAGVNGISGQFSLLCKGRLIENGRDVRAVNEITISGSFTGLLQAVERVGSDLRFSMPGGSCFGSPSLLIGEAMIAGKASE